MFTRIDAQTEGLCISKFVLLLCLPGWIIFSKSQQCPSNCKASCISCLASTMCPYITSPIQMSSTSDCSCPATEAVDCSKCLFTNPTTTITQTTATTTPQITTTQITTSAAMTTIQITTTPTIQTTSSQITTTQITTAAAITTTTKLLTSSAYPEPADQQSGLCLDNQGPFIGAAIGGAIFGSILTAIVFVYINRRSKNSYNSKDDQTRTVRNAAYGYTNDNDQVNTMTVPGNSAYTEINDGMRKSAGLSPIMRQADCSKSDEVYNHLHESDKEDRSDYYAHAGPAPSLSVMEDGYGVLSMESEENDYYNMLDRNYSTDCGKSMTAENTKSDNYFILETQNN